MSSNLRMRTSKLTMIQELSPNEQCHWYDLKVPDYQSFKDTEKVAKPVVGTLKWLVEEHKNGPSQDNKSFQRDDFVTWRESPSLAPLLVIAAPGQGEINSVKFCC